MISSDNSDTVGTTDSSQPDTAPRSDAATGPAPTAEAVEAVRDCARRARAAVDSLARADAATIDTALRGIAETLLARADEVLKANQEDVAAAEAGGMPAATIDRLRLDPTRLESIATQLQTLAAVEPEPTSRWVRDLPGDLRLEEHRRPIGVVGANFEARPNVVVDIASQLLKSRNAGVLRTGSAAIRSATALIDHVIAPALQTAGLNPEAIQLVRIPGRDTAAALVAQPDLIRLVILRGSGESTRRLAETAARHGVRVLAHAEGGGVLYVDRAADAATVTKVIEASLDRLGVCNRLNLLLLHKDIAEERLPSILEQLTGLGIKASLPPHPHPRGHEWALDEGNEATVTIDTVSGPLEAAQIANTETSGLAATILTEDPEAARTFLEAYHGTAALWNATTRLVDGFKMLAVPETGINVDQVPGPRGPVTFHDLFLRQYVVVPRAAASDRH